MEGRRFGVARGVVGFERRGEKEFNAWDCNGGGGDKGNRSVGLESGVLRRWLRIKRHTDEG